MNTREILYSLPEENQKKSIEVVFTSDEVQKLNDLAEDFKFIVFRDLRPFRDERLQKQLAHNLDVSSATISKYLNHQNELPFHRLIHIIAFANRFQNNTIINFQAGVINKVVSDIPTGKAGIGDWHQVIRENSHLIGILGESLADGHIDPHEKGLILKELAELNGSVQSIINKSQK